MKNKILIGTRGSKLALIQAESVAHLLKKLHPELKVDLLKILTEGDRDRSVSLDHTGTIGVFVRALEEALIQGKIDLAVHSLKDMPAELPGRLCLAAVTRREDPRDTLVAGRKLNDLPSGSTIGTGSLRRSVQLKAIRPDLQVCGIRGNVDTRLRKVSSGQVDGVILAAAALRRLGLEDKVTEYLPVDRFIPAVGQGALALECRKDDALMVKLAGENNHLPTWQEITAERAFLHALGGGCRAPITALAVNTDGILKITGMVSDTEGSRLLIDSHTGEADSAAAAGVELAKKMMQHGAGDIIHDVRSA